MRGENGDAPGGSREYMRRAVDASLGRLRRDHIDLCYYHRPDGVTPLEETLGAMHELVVEGKVRWLGLSNVGTGALDTAAALAAAGSSPVVAVQNHFSLLNREDDAVVARAAELGIGYVPYFPLESGLLTGKYRRGQEHPAGARLTRCRRRPARRGTARAGRGAGGVRGKSWAHDPRARDRRPRVDPGCRVGDRRGDLAGTGAGECGRGRLAPGRRRARRGRRGLTYGGPGSAPSTTGSPTPSFSAIQSSWSPNASGPGA